jgi:heme/copper-type cytochrome/quinol oxidase subunit 1
VRAVLFIAGFASLALTIALLTLQPRNPDTSYWLAVVGSILFCVQTLIMDSFIWAANFKY